MEAWWFSRSDGALQWGDGRVARVGETHTVDGPAVLCKHGLHASVSVFDSLKYAPGTLLWRVDVGGDVVIGDDRIAGTTRTYIECADAEKMLRAFIRWCALSAAHRWNVPDVMARWLVTGDETLRSAAMDAARDASLGAACGASMSAPRCAALWVSQRAMFDSMVDALMAGNCWWAETATKVRDAHA